MLEIKTVRRVETGDRYISDLVDLDTAVGSYLLKLVDSLKSFGTNKKYDPFVSFTHRDKSQKLYLSTEVDPKRFLTQIRQTLFAQDGDHNQSNKALLPLIYFHRAPNFAMDAETKDIVIRNVGAINDEQNNVIAEIDAIPLIVRYHIYILAWEQVSLTKLSAALFAAMATSPRHSNYKTMIFNSIFDSQCVIAPPLQSEWNDMSASNTEDRLLVLESSFEVQANMYQARVIKNHEVTFSISPPALFNDSL